MIENNYYKNSVIEAVKNLTEIREAIFLTVFNIAMAGELKEWNDSVEVGETYEFNKEIFEGCSDINIKLLTRLMDIVEDTANSISNLNST